MCPCCFFFLEYPAIPFLHAADTDIKCSLIECQLNGWLSFLYMYVLKEEDRIAKRELGLLKDKLTQRDTSPVRDSNKPSRRVPWPVLWTNFICIMSIYFLSFDYHFQAYYYQCWKINGDQTLLNQNHKMSD